MEEEKRNWKRNKDKWERVKKKKAGEQEQGYMWTLECILLLTKTRPFHEGLNLGHECRILPVCLPPIWCSIIHCWGGCSLYCTGQLPLSLPLSLSLSLPPSPSPRISHKRNHAHTNFCLSLPLALRHSSDGSIVTVLGSERTDGEGERERGRWRWGERRGWHEGEDRWIKGRKNSSGGSRINITASRADIIDCIRGGFVNP